MAAQSSTSTSITSSIPTSTVSIKMPLSHISIGNLLLAMDPYLPPSTINRPGYKGCRTTYGLLNTTYQRARTSTHPSREYTQLVVLERELRRRLHALDAAKGIPVKMLEYLDQFKEAVEGAVEAGVDVEWVEKGVEEAEEEEREVGLRVREKMVTESRYRKVKGELGEANERVRRLNEENNELVLRVKRLELEVGRSRGVR